MSYKADRPSLKKPEKGTWATKLWDWLKAAFWLIVILCILGGLGTLVLQAINNQMEAAKPGSKVGLP